MPEQAPRVRNWKQSYTWRKDHPAKGAFAAVVAGQVEQIVTPVWWHVCWVCDNTNAPFGDGKRYFCREHWKP